MLDQLRLRTITAMLYVQELRRRENGQALVEYALILGLISVVAILALTNIGTGVRSKLTQIATDL
jgi:pilus assembly protein Flp/PilA